MYAALTQEHSLRSPTLVASYVSLYSIHVSARRLDRLKSPNNLQEDEKNPFIEKNHFTCFHLEPIFSPNHISSCLQCVCVSGGEREREREGERDGYVCVCIYIDTYIYI